MVLGTTKDSNRRDFFNYAGVLSKNCKELSTTYQKEELIKNYNSFQYFLLDQRQRKKMSLSLIAVLKGRTSIHKFWIAQGSEWPVLQQLSRRVISMVASTATSERNFS